jgi:hypothetical protein
MSGHCEGVCTSYMQRVNSVRLNFCTRVFHVLRVPKQGVQKDGSPVLEVFLGSPRANFLVFTWVERPYCPISTLQNAWKFLPETVRSCQARFVPDTIAPKLFAHQALVKRELPFAYLCLKRVI